MSTQDARHDHDSLAAALAPGIPRVPDLITTWSERTPESLAVAHGAATHDYGELARCALAIRDELTARRCGAGAVVAIQGPRSFGLICTMVGTVAAGSALMLLGDDLPAHRRSLMMRTAEPALLIVVDSGPSHDFRAEPDLPLGVFHVDPATACVREVTAVHSTVRRWPLPPHDQAAYVCFTSGSSGAPKGVLGSHRGLSHFLQWQRDEFGVQPSDRIGQLTSLTFDVVLRDILLPLCSGASVHLPPDEVLARNDVVEWAAAQGITILHAVPSLADHWLADAPAGRILDRLRLTFFAGEPLTDVLVQRWRCHTPPSSTVVNLYGATEATLAQVRYVVPDPPDPGIQPVGRPLPGFDALVVDPTDRPMPAGSIGEVVISSRFLSLGYLNPDDADERRFAASPSADDPADRIYRSGDRGRYRPDGMLELMGRLDRQIKVHGVRVVLDEIESALCAHPSVRNAVVHAKDGGLPLTAVAIAREAEPRVDELRQFLLARLPRIMVPTRFRFVATLPLLPSGKIDRLALRPLCDDGASREGGDSGNDSPAANALYAVVSEVLGLEAVDPQFGFVALGGDSLRAAQVIGRMWRRYSLTIGMRLLFEAPSLEVAASHVSAPSDSDALRVSRRIDESRRSASLPESPPPSNHA